MATTEPEIKASGILPSSEAPSDVEKGTNDSTEDEKPFERGIPDWQWYLTSVGLFLGALLYGLDTTISASVQGPILSSLGEIEKLAWVGIGFPMGSVSVILLLGWCYAVFEIKYLINGSVLAFEAGSALCAAAPTMNAMIFGRVIAGIGGAGMYLGLVSFPTPYFTEATSIPLLYGALTNVFYFQGPHIHLNIYPSLLPTYLQCTYGNFLGNRLYSRANHWR
jgi:MFS family permease